MNVSIGNAFPAPQVSRPKTSERQVVRRFTNHVGTIEGLAHRMSRNALRWLANRRVWSPRVTAAPESFQSSLISELESVRREMLARTGVDIAIGAARSRGVARTASRAAGTAGVLLVAVGQERAFLAPLPLRQLDGVSEATLRILKTRGLVTIGELQRVPKAALQAEFGRAEGLRLWRAARGMDCAFGAGPAAGAGMTERAHPKTRLLSGLLRAPWRTRSAAS